MVSQVKSLTSTSTQYGVSSEIKGPQNLFTFSANKPMHYDKVAQQIISSVMFAVEAASVDF